MLARNFLQLGFAAVVISLLPPLLILFSLHEHTVWRMASVVAFIFPLWFAVSYPARRFAATGTRMPKLVWSVMLALYAAAGVFLLNAIGKPIAPGPGLFALGATIIVFTSFQAFLNALRFFLSQPGASPKTEQAPAPSS